MFDMLCIRLIMSKEIRDAHRSRWFLLLTLIFAGLAVGLALLGMSALGTLGGAGFGRTTASLLNLVTLIVPLMGLLMSALSVAGEREHGTLFTILAQPVVLEEVLLGKFLGLASALLGTILFGFGLAALVIYRQGGMSQVGPYLGLIGYTFFLGLGFVSVGFLISSFSRKTASAVGVALFVWLTCEFLSDLGLIGTSIVLQLTPRTLLWLSLLNPPLVFKLAVLGDLHHSLETLGPGGLYATELFGHWLQPFLLLILAVWVVVPFIASILVLRYRGVA